MAYFILDRNNSNNKIKHKGTPSKRHPNLKINLAEICAGEG